AELYTVMAAVDGPLFVFGIRVLRALALAGMGFSAEALVVVVLFDAWQGLSSHTGVDTHNPWLSRVLVTPETHRMHHSVSHAGNYAVLFTLWDRVFGTWVAPSVEVPRLGLAEHERWHRLLFLLRSSARATPPRSPGSRA
ncbi:MAG: sterol desaturase family protein, partial [Myxococcaceae bacterium]|nr:sterol desaturase family protein [Myxococcaceae bacterium]